MVFSLKAGRQSHLLRGDAETAALARSGDRRAAAGLLLELLPRVRNLVRLLVRGDRDADDITQEALIVLLRGLPSYRGDGPLAAWADRTVARATFAELRRRRADRKLVAIAEDRPEANERLLVQPDEYLWRRWAVRVLDELPDDQRHALVLHHLVEMSVPEIATELNIPQETVRSRLRIGRGRLRARGVALGGMGEGQG